MKKYILLVILFSITFIALSQTITNTGAKVVIKNGTTVKFTNLHNSQAGGYFYYDTDLDVPGNWTNVSPATFDQGTNGAVTLNGSSQQTVTSGGSAFQDLTINNATANDAEILLGDNLEIESQLTLTDGIINTNSNKLVFQSSATSNSGNAGSFVHGEMEKSGATQFTFPCGDVISRDLNGDASDEDYVIWSPMRSNPVASTTVNVEYFFDNAGMPDWWEYGGNMDATLHHVSDREYWLVSSTENFTTVTLYWNDNDHAVGGICPHSFCDGTPGNYDNTDLSVAYWTGSLWRDAGGTATNNHDVGNIESSLTIPFGAKSQTFITYGSKDNQDPLPVELLDFYSDCNDNKVELFWNTASETNNKGFFIEISEDGKNFKQIGYIAGAGNSTDINSYSFIDKESYGKFAYYRLKQIDYNGESTVSTFIYAGCENIENEPYLEIYPNPFKNNINVIAENLPKEDIVLNIYNMLGSLIHQVKPDPINGSFRINIDLAKLPPAMYVVKVISGDFVGIVKIEKHQ